MLHELLAAGLRPDFVIGTSVGAINAAYFAGQPDMAGITRLEEIWCKLRRRDVFPLSIASILGLLAGRGSLVSPQPLRRLITEHLSYARLELARLPLHVMATSQQGLGVRLSSGPSEDAILASTAIPGIFPPVAIDGKMLMDGAIAANTPLHEAIRMGADRLVVLPTGYACAMNQPPRSAVGRMLHAITLLVARQLRQELEHIPEGVRIRMAPTLCPLAISPHDFSASTELINRSCESTRRWLAAGGLKRQANARELATHHHH